MAQEVAKKEGGQLARSYSGEQLALLKRTLGGGKLNNDEFDLFMETSKHLQLDPFKKQIVPIVFNANNPSKRRVEHIVTQQGYRSRAHKTGTWGPWVDEEAMRNGKEPTPNPMVVFNEKLQDPDTNPLGIDYAVYYCKKYRNATSDSFDIVMGKARWIERVPLKEIWERDEKAGKDQPTGKYRIASPEWGLHGQPAHMIGKCAEVDALRRGWPDEFSGFYGEEEMERALAIDESASKMAEAAESERRMKAVGGKDTILFTWNAGDPMTAEDVGKLPDKVLAWLQEQEHPLAVQKFEERNAAALNQLWAVSKSDALGVKEAIEKRVKELSVIDVEDEQLSPEGDRSVNGE